MGNLTTTSIYASWNGATEVATWTVYKTNAIGDRTRELRTVPRSGFETTIDHDGYAKYVYVEAKDSRGYSLGKSGILETVSDTEISPESLAEEMVWLNGDPDTWKVSLPSRGLMQDIGVFVGGVACGIVMLGSIMYTRRRGVKWWLGREGPKYSRVGEDDAAEYDETKLDDLSRSRRYRDGAESGSLKTSEEEVDDRPR